MPPTLIDHWAWTNKLSENIPKLALETSKFESGACDLPPVLERLIPADAADFD